MVSDSNHSLGVALAVTFAGNEKFGWRREEYLRSSAGRTKGVAQATAVGAGRTRYQQTE